MRETFHKNPPRKLPQELRLGFADVMPVTFAYAIRGCIWFLPMDVQFQVPFLALVRLVLVVVVVVVVAVVVVVVVVAGKANDVG